MSESTDSTTTRRPTDAQEDLETKLRVEGLRKTFGNEVAVDDLSLEIKKGTLKSLLGPSGCGKTTTLRCIAGLERPDRGKIWIGDELVSDPENGVHVEPENRGIGMVFQSYAVWPHMTVAENVKYPLKIQKIGSKSEREDKVMQVLDAVGLTPYKNNLATNLSGGQQQRVAISRALVNEPDILLFDEPLSNLDAKLRREMRVEINRIYHEFNTTVLYVTHSQDEAMFLSDEIAVMRDGEIIEEGPPATLHSDPQTFFGMNFMGRCNTLRGSLVSIDDEMATVETAVGELHSDRLMDGVGVGDEVFACFRPKSCRLLVDEAAPATDTEDVLSGEIALRAATQDFTEYTITVRGQDLLVRTPEPLPVYAGDEVNFTVGYDDVKLFRYDEHEQMDVEAEDAITEEPDPAANEAVEADFQVASSE